MSIDHNLILGLVLAGGQSRRMDGGNKWALPLGDRPIIEHIIERLSPQVANIVINGSDTDLATLPYPLIDDSIDAFQGPLAGLLAGLEHAKSQNIAWVASSPCDTPFLPTNVVEQLADTIVQEKCLSATVTHNHIIHGVVGLWSSTLSTPLRTFMENKQQRSLKAWIAHLSNHSVTTAIQACHPNAFFNINTHEEWQQAQKIYEQDFCHSS